MAAKSSTAEAPPNPFLIAGAEEARDADMRYSSDAQSGILRQKVGKGILKSYLAVETIAMVLGSGRKPARAASPLKSSEAAVLTLLKRCLKKRSAK